MADILTGILFLLAVACCGLGIASLITPKAACLLKQPTKLRGFLVGLGLCLVLMFAAGLTAPKREKPTPEPQAVAPSPATAPKVETPAPAPKAEAPKVEAPKAEAPKTEAPKPAAVPHYVAKIESDMPSIKLSLDCTIDAPVDTATLEKLARELFAKHKGKKYERVFMMWYLPHYKPGSGAWAVSNFENGKLTEVKIMALQG